MRFSTAKFVLFIAFVVCFITTQVAAKHHHKDCDDDGDEQENWDGDNDWNDNNYRNRDNDDNDWDTNSDWDNSSDWDANDWEHNNGDWDNSASSTWSESLPISTYGQPTDYYPSGESATITVTYTHIYTATSAPSNYSNHSQMSNMASVKSIGVPVTLAAIMFTMVILT
ncbi:hypothetical protein INT46_011347 [Mucor plumbeus]|uniref:Uncharacterized protein n=1 Tax=Mucor plumbeus TaxID=97098 RepID=A0A8H7QF27_9FUNG|nr:hypothetical protein INT46_011347 [Mucor plumbeus]